MKKIYLLLLSTFVALTTGCLSGSVSLTKEGNPAAKIVIAQKPTKAARLGALELQYHLKLVTGMEFPVITDAQPQTGFEIRVGESKRSKAKKKDFKMQQYLIDVNPEYIELIGYDKADYGKIQYKVKNGKIYSNNLPSAYDAQGTLYAVYEFLEDHCGVLWIDPTDYGTHVTENKNLSVPVMKKRGEPFIGYRGGTFHSSYDPNWYHHRAAGVKRYNAIAYKDRKNIRAQKKLFLLRMRAGGELAPANHSFYWYYDRFRNPKHKNYEGPKPEIFAKGYPSNPPQLCYTNPETIRLVVQDARDYFDKGGFKNVYRTVRKGYIWGENNYCLEPMDNSAYCLCERCVPEYEPHRQNEYGQHSTHWFKFVNKVAKELKKTHPDKKIITLAYGSHEALPTNLELEDNVLVYFCISANRTAYRPLLQQQLDRMLQWRNTYPNHPFAMWLYNTFPKEIASNGNFHCFPGLFAKESVRQYQLFKKWNIRAGIFHCGFVDNVDNWVHLKLMVNPDYTADELLTNYFRPYGKAGKYLREFYELIEDRYGDKSIYPAGSAHQTVHLAWGVLGTPEIMAKLEKLMIAAEKAAETPEEKARVKLWRTDIYEYMKEGFDSYQVRKANPEPTWTFHKIPSANGDFAKVNWKSLPEQKLPLYIRGGKTVWKLGDSTRLRGGYDDKYFYMELTEFVDPSKLKLSAKIVPYDVWEIVIALQQAQPYRHFMCGPDGRIFGASFGEVNWRQNVSSEESGLVNYGVKCQTDRTQKNCWTIRYVFPLATMLDKPLKAGDEFYMNLTRVTNPQLLNDIRLGIYTAVSYTTVHTIDRSAKIILKK